MPTLPLTATVLWLCCSAPARGQSVEQTEPNQSCSPTPAGEDEHQPLRAELGRKLAELERLRSDISGLRRELGAPQQFHLRIEMLEIQHSQVTDATKEQLGLKSGEHGSKRLVLAARERAVDNADAPAGGLTESQRLLHAIKVLRSAGAVKVLAEPELVITDGVPARLLDGGEFPMVVPQQAREVRVAWREVGVRIEALAKTTGAQRVRLEVTVENSERDFSNAVAIAGAQVPGLRTTRTNSRAEVRLGEPLVIGGMLSARDRNGTDEVVETVVVVTLDEHVSPR